MTYYVDIDSDGYGNANTSLDTCAMPTGYVLDNTDCDDTDAAVNPGATEVCDGIDNDCNGTIDDGLIMTYYADIDADGYGDTNSSIDTCVMLTGYVLDNSDCDDLDANVNPSMTEICDDAIDNNCDGQIDELCLPDCDSTHLVIDTIGQATYNAEINITSSALVDELLPVSYQAGMDIDLGTNFEVTLGTEFEAIIEPCNPVPIAPATSNQRLIIPRQDLGQLLSKDLEDGLTLRVSVLDEYGKVVSAKEGDASILNEMQQLLLSHEEDKWKLSVEFLEK